MMFYRDNSERCMQMKRAKQQGSAAHQLSQEEDLDPTP
jgi:hypothetical protein